MAIRHSSAIKRRSKIHKLYAISVALQTTLLNSAVLVPMDILTLSALFAMSKGIFLKTAHKEKETQKLKNLISKSNKFKLNIFVNFLNMSY